MMDMQFMQLVVIREVAGADQGEWVGGVLRGESTDRRAS
jgi:hypothetical protein